MATYTHQEVNQQQQTIQRTMSDNEVKTYFPPQVQLTANKLTFTADGVDFATITAQLVSVPLSDDTRAPLAIVHKVILLVSETAVELTTDVNGKAVHEIAATDAGTYDVTAQNLSSNKLTFQAV